MRPLLTRWLVWVARLAPQFALRLALWIRSARLSSETWQLVWPVLVQESLLVLVSLGIVWLATRLGTESVAAVGMVEALSILCNTLLTALGTGSTVAVAQAVGRRDKPRACRIMLHVLFSNCLLGLALALFFYGTSDRLITWCYGEAEAGVQKLARDYLHWVAWSYPLLGIVIAAGSSLRGVGSARPTMQINLLMDGLTLLCCLPLMFGALGLGDWNGFGIQGAGAAQIIGRLVAACLAIHLLRIGFRGVRLPHPRRWQFEPGVLHTVWSVGATVGVESLMFNIGKLLTQIMIAGQGAAALAANHIAGTFGTLMNIPGNALAIALMTLVGQAIGRQQTRQARELLRTGVQAGVVFLGGLGLIALPLVYPYAWFYTHGDSRVTWLVCEILLLNCFFMLSWPTSFVLAAGLRGAGDTRYVMICAICTMWIVRVALSYVLAIVLGMGVVGVWLGMYIDWAARSILFLRRYRSGRWLRKALVRSHEQAGKG